MRVGVRGGSALNQVINAFHAFVKLNADFKKEGRDDSAQKKGMRGNI